MILMSQYSGCLMDTEVIFVSFIGADVAIFAKRHFAEILTSLTSFKTKDYKTALTESFIEVDLRLASETGKIELAEIHNELLGSSNEMPKGEFADCMGCTAGVVISTNEEIVVANSGD